ncbi:MAG TPA: HAMP domain-containing sensor histidine kinase [Caulobacteraceae bacterium]|nr:HAMP domain-containing sensor histidine kinase [Caulobacteraceae bacterium]
MSADTLSGARNAASAPAEDRLQALESPAIEDGPGKARRARSLLWRIIGLHVIALIAAAAAMLFAVVTLLNATFTRAEHLTLRRHEREILGALSYEQANWRLSLPPDVRALYSGGQEGFSYTVLDDRGDVLFASRPGHAPLLAVNPHATRASFYQEVVDAGIYTGGSFPETIAGRRIWVQVTQDLTKPDMIIDDVILSYLRRIGWLLAPVLLGLAVIDVYIVRRALQPVLDASQRAEAITPNSLQVRLPTTSLPREIEPLAKAINQALDRLEEGFTRQREFTADAAHELRTPLSILRMRVEGLPDRETAQPLLDDIDAMTRVVSQLLEMSELDAMVLDPSLKTDLSDLGERVVSYLAPYALARKKRIALTGADRPVWVHGDPDILFQAARNLVENAVEHTPQRRSVEVHIEAPGTFCVMDNGPGVPDGERALIFKRFWRRNRRLAKGAGLGLSIVTRIADAHGGSVRVENRPQGGAMFTIELRSA